MCDSTEAKLSQIRVPLPNVLTHCHFLLTKEIVGNNCHFLVTATQRNGSATRTPYHNRAFFSVQNNYLALVLYSL